jgi:hypothetical protein
MVERMRQEQEPANPRVPISRQPLRYRISSANHPK